MHEMSYDQDTQMWVMTVRVTHEALISNDKVLKDSMSGYGLVRQLLTMSPATLMQPVVMEVEDMWQQVRAVADGYTAEDANADVYPVVRLK